MKFIEYFLYSFMNKNFVIYTENVEKFYLPSIHKEKNKEQGKILPQIPGGVLEQNTQRTK